MSCQLTEVETRKVLDVATAGHKGFVDNAAFSVDSTSLISIDTGHRGQYTVCTGLMHQIKTAISVRPN